MAGTFFRTYAPALVGAAASVLMARTLPVSPFFLVPIGIVALTRGVAPTAAAALATVALNFVVVYLNAGPTANQALFALFADSAYFLAIVSSFCWASYGGERRFPIRLRWRLTAAALASTLVLMPILLAAGRDKSVVDYFYAQAAGIAEAFKAGAGADVVQKSLMDREFTAESVVRTFALVVTRGALVGHLAFFGMSWRLARMVASFRYPALRSRGEMLSFRNGAYLVWALIASLLAVMGAELSGNAVLAAVSWNVMLLCVLFYAAQGAAIVLYNLARPGVPPFLRSMIILSAVLVAFRPGINAAVVVALASVGVAENWLPLRAPIKTEPPSTPEA